MGDIVVVALGVGDLCNPPLGQLKLLRMLRAFRIFRLFGKNEELNKVLMSILNAMPGVLNAFVVVVIVMCIYSVLAVDLYGGVFAKCKLDGDSDHPVAVTARNVCFGEDYYGNFRAAFYTMFQILTGESWSEGAVRPILMA